jgi:hypothetical protein
MLGEERGSIRTSIAECFLGSEIAEEEARPCVDCQIFPIQTQAATARRTSKTCTCLLMGMCKTEHVFGVERTLQKDDVKKSCNLWSFVYSFHDRVAYDRHMLRYINLPFDIQTVVT